MPGQVAVLGVVEAKFSASFDWKGRPVFLRGQDHGRQGTLVRVGHPLVRGHSESVQAADRHGSNSTRSGSPAITGIWSWLLPSASADLHPRATTTYLEGICPRNVHRFRAVEVVVVVDVASVRARQRRVVALVPA